MLLIIKALMLEARVGIEPTHKGFADLSLTTWVPRLGQEILLHAAWMKPVGDAHLSEDQIRADWSGRRDLNPRPSPWQGDALPLSYSRWVLFEYIGRVRERSTRPCLKTLVPYHLPAPLTREWPYAPGYTPNRSAEAAARIVVSAMVKH